MCGRFSQGEPSHRISDYFGAYPDDDLPDGLYNVPPTETIRMVVQREDERRLVAAQWGFRPFWAAGDRRPGAKSWINARSETAWDSSVFGRSLRGRRCIVPADAFYEWDRTTSPRQPYAIGPAAEGGMLALAGIWTPLHDEGLTAAILTTAPNELLAPIHDRMPVILDADGWEAWLDPDADLGLVAALMRPAPADQVRMWPVSTAVNRVASDGPDLLRPVETAPTLGLA
ncbi:MAG: SOS response-associated peptidase [Chloroflexi bacterium]|nr:SOS response-associated peptidase [Chloroflexota bacterium]